MSLPHPISLSPSAIPCVFLSFESSIFAAFTPYKLKTGQTTNPADVVFLYDPDKSYNVPETEEAEKVVDLFEGPLDTFIDNLKMVFRIRGDLILELKDLELTIHEDSVHLKSLSLRKLYDLYTAWCMSKRFSPLMMPPMKITLVPQKHAFVDRYTFLCNLAVRMQQGALLNPYAGKGGSEEEPISLDDEDDVEQSAQELLEETPSTDDAVEAITPELESEDGPGDGLVIVDNPDQSMEIPSKPHPGLDPEETAVDLSPISLTEPENLLDLEKDKDMDMSLEPGDSIKRAATEDLEIASKKAKEGD